MHFMLLDNKWHSLAIFSSKCYASPMQWWRSVLCGCKNGGGYCAKRAELLELCCYYDGGCTELCLLLKTLLSQRTHPHERQCHSIRNHFIVKLLLLLPGISQFVLMCVCRLSTLASYYPRVLGGLGGCG